MGQPVMGQVAPEQQRQQHEERKPHPAQAGVPDGIGLRKKGGDQAHRTPSHEGARRQHAHLPQQIDVFTVVDQARQKVVKGDGAVQGQKLCVNCAERMLT